jgi:hypothetical protein
VRRAYLITIQIKKQRQSEKRIRNHFYSLTIE